MASEEELITYALNKQIGSVYAIMSNYGEFELDAGERAAVEKALRPKLESRLKRIKKTQK
jgi:hypothetical protein